MVPSIRFAVKKYFSNILGQLRTNKNFYFEMRILVLDTRHLGKFFRRKIFSIKTMIVLFRRVVPNAKSTVLSRGTVEISLSSTTKTIESEYHCLWDTLIV